MFTLHIWRSQEHQENTAGCSRAEDLSTADQAEAEAGRTGAIMQPDPAAQPGAGGHRQLQEEARTQCG